MLKSIQLTCPIDISTGGRGRRQEAAEVTGGRKGRGGSRVPSPEGLCREGQLIY